MRKLLLEHIINIDYNTVEKLLADFLSKYLEGSRSKGFVIGLSGGLDSSTTLALAVRSVGPERVVALIMPDKDVTPEEDIIDAVEFAKDLKVKYHVVEISKAIELFKHLIPVYEDDEKDRVPLGNLRARVRMCILYYYANKLNYLVLGASDRSEYLIGYFTKYGDGGVDIAPLITLYKTQVREFAKYLGVPKRIIMKPSAPRLWKNHLAEEELGIKYEDIDLILSAYMDLRITKKDIPKVVGVNKNVVDRVLNMYRVSIHKRQPIATPIQPILNVVKSMIIKNAEQQYS